MTEIEDRHGVIMSGVDQPLLNPHNLMGNGDRQPTQQELERRIGRLEHRNTYLKRENEQLREINAMLEVACTYIIEDEFIGSNLCHSCGIVNVSAPHLARCPTAAAEKALTLQKKLTTSNKQLGGE